MTSRSVSRILEFGKLALTASFACALLAPSAASAQKPYSVQTRWTVGGDGGWDYLTADAGAHRLYVTHGTRVEVLDTNSGKVVGNIQGLQGIHGVALDNAGKYGYISDGRAGAVVVFDRASLKTLASIPVGTNPDGIVFEPVTKTVWAFNGRSSDVSVIDTATRKVVATIALPGKPEFPVADGKGTIFDNIETKNSIVRLDAKTKTLTATWPLTNCESPSGLAMDQAGRRLFTVCDGKTMNVVDANSGKVLATPAIGDGPDAAAYDPAHKLAFASNGDGTLTVVDASKNTFPVLQNVATQKGARTMSLDTATGRIYLVTAEFGPKPAATATNPRPRPAILPGSFTVLVVGR
ncbi:YncE family protein [Edaphobacter paludis]|uniref:YncE family protein n=1 Tax=Edaphobacter paludis TaxID=3035702 RepID=A0AAU7D429_9BACT